MCTQASRHDIQGMPLHRRIGFPLPSLETKERDGELTASTTPALTTITCPALQTLHVNFQDLPMSLPEVIQTQSRNGDSSNWCPAQHAIPSRFAGLSTILVISDGRPSPPNTRCPLRVADNLGLLESVIGKGMAIFHDDGCGARISENIAEQRVWNNWQISQE